MKYQKYANLLEIVDNLILREIENTENKKYLKDLEFIRQHIDLIDVVEKEVEKWV